MATEWTRRQLLQDTGGLVAGVTGSVKIVSESRVAAVSDDRDVETTDCRMHRYDAQNSGTVDTTGPTEPVESVWTFQTGGALRAQPIVADGKVFVVSSDSRVYAVSAATGEQEWSTGTNGPLSKTPAIRNSILYVPTETDRFLALSTATGAGQWATALPKNSQTSPTVVDDTIYAGYWDYYYGYVALNAATGSQQYQEELFTNDYTEPMDRILYDDGTIFALAPEYNGITALNASDRTVQWENDSSDTSAASIANNTYYVAAGSDVTAYDVEDGSQKWRFTNISGAKTPPTYYDGALYVTTEDGGIHAIDPSIGTRSWQSSVEGSPTAPTVVDDTVYFGSTDNRVYAYDGVSGERLWTFTTGNSIEAPPTVLDGTVYVASTDKVLYALRETGAVSPGDVNGDGNPARDLDEDGLYEDVNGDGAFTIVDVQALFANLDSDVVQNNQSKFDFNGDGEVDVTDVQALYARLER